MPAKTLVQLAMATAIKHHRSLHDVGDLPYSLLRPLLQKIENPEKLHSLEVLSPHLAAADKELWLDFIKRDIPQWEQYELPEDTNHWYEVYQDLQDQVQRSLDADAAKLKLAIDGIQSERARLTPKIIPGPRGKHISGERATVRRRVPPSTRSELSSGSGSKKNSIFAPQRRNNVLAVPTKHLSTRASQVRQAPRGLVEEHRRPAEQLAVKRSESTIRSPRGLIRPNQQGPAVAGGDGGVRSEGEARLLALTSGKPVPSDQHGETRRSTGTSREVPVKSPIKRAINSPPAPATKSGPPLSSSSVPVSPPSSTNTPTTASPSPARPVMMRKRPTDDPFLRPKKRRMN